MSYLDTLLEIQNKVVSDDNYEINERVVLIDLIKEKEKQVKAEEDYFIYFYTDVSDLQEIFDYSDVLGDGYVLAQEHASTCVSMFSSFSVLGEDVKLISWLQSAIRFVDCIVIHYLQEILKEKPENQGDAGKERSRYIQITRKGIKAEKAGRIMDNLYDERNNMEHITKTDPGNPDKQIMHPPNYKRVKRNINRRFPEALKNFNEAFEEHYHS